MSEPLSELHAILVQLPLAVAMFAQQAGRNGARIKAWTTPDCIHVRFHLVAVENRAALENVGFRLESRYAPNGPGGAGELFDAWWSSDGSTQKKVTMRGE